MNRRSFIGTMAVTALAPSIIPEVVKEPETKLIGWKLVDDVLIPEWAPIDYVPEKTKILRPWISKPEWT